MKYKFLFSIPVHEKPEVVIDQIINFTQLNPNSAVVLHLSKGFNYDNALIPKEEFFEILSGFDNVFINPNHLRTSLLDIIQAHISNYEYVKDRVDFEYYCLSASNELFVNKGLDAFVRDYDCGIGNRKYVMDPDKTDSWPQFQHAVNDKSLKGILKELDSNCFFGSQVEGIFFKKQLFEFVSAMINKHYDYHAMTDAYAREEVYFSTIVNNLKKQPNVLPNGYYTYVPWEREGFDVYITDIERIKSKKSPSFFSVKRVDRTLNCNVRKYLRGLYSYYDKEIRIIGDSVEVESLTMIKKKDKREQIIKRKQKRTQRRENRIKKLKKKIRSIIKR